MIPTFTTISEATSFIATPSSKAVVSINMEESLVQVSWSATPNVSEVTECADYVASLIEQYNLSQLLHDVRQVECAHVDLQQSLAHVFCPRIIAAGITKVVHLANYAIPDLFIMDQIVAVVKQKYVKNRLTNFEICTTPEGAAEWFNHNIFRQQEVVAKAKETVKLTAPQTAPVNEVSNLQAAIKSYKEKANLVYRIVFKSKALYSNV